MNAIFTSLDLTETSACVAGLLRMVFVIKDAHSADGTYTGGFLSVFSSIEVNVGIIAACLVALPPVVKKYPVRSLGNWSLSSLKSRLRRRSERKSARSNKKSKHDSFHGLSVHLPTSGGFTELRETSKSEASVEGDLGEQDTETGRYHTEGFGV
ncbi:MAG: hypothetical protein ALECFALPRED_006474 [Alectoria fallacina]|uniref:Rhodopsin domain-containing protein n=1 Tax=Alectoria fallacina TaxID=1903189 RepID=A0A8H3G9Q7_9LECA|nr:MAG: hypothetical protein ALECFALPRED_006474 [Alectoria fallacina]